MSGRYTELENDSAPIAKQFDVHDTTFWDMMTHMASEFYNPNISLPTKFSGKVYRVEKNSSNFNGTAQSQMFSELNIDNTQCKVWLEGGAYSIYCKPNTFDATPEDRILCNQLKDVSLSKETIDNIDGGQSVVVTSHSNNDLQNLTIEYAYSSKASGEKSNGTSNTNNPSGAYANKSPQP